MKTQYYVASTLDGFIATADDSLAWLFALGEPQESSYAAFIANVGALAMGASTYEWILRNTDATSAETGSAWPYQQPTWVFTHRKLPVLVGADVRFCSGDVKTVAQEMRLAAKGGNLWIVGGGDLAGQFYDANLLDELIVTIGSTTLGRGKPLLPRQTTGSLRLTAVHQMSEGLVELRYDVIK